MKTKQLYTKLKVLFGISIAPRVTRRSRRRSLSVTDPRVKRPSARRALSVTEGDFALEPSDSAFICLPYEIRRMIYDLLLEDCSPVVYQDHANKRLFIHHARNMMLSLSLASRQTYLEWTRLMYDRVTFRPVDMSALNRLLSCMPKHHLPWFRRIEMYQGLEYHPRSTAVRLQQWTDTWRFYARELHGVGHLSVIYNGKGQQDRSELTERMIREDSELDSACLEPVMMVPIPTDLLIVPWRYNRRVNSLPWRALPEKPPQLPIPIDEVKQIARREVSVEYEVQYGFQRAVLHKACVLTHQRIKQDFLTQWH